MSQVDWVSDPVKPTFKDIRNTRGSVAQEKAELLLTLGELITKIPPHIKVGGSVNDVRLWREARTSAAKIARQLAVKRLRNHFGDQQHAAGV